MKKPILIAILATLFSCNLNTKTNVDTRPKNQLVFNHIVDSLQSEYSITNSAKTDVTTEWFNKYALDSLRNIKNWEVIVNEVSDNIYGASSVAKQALDLGKPFYNLKMYSVIKMYDKINPSLDSLNLPQGNVIFITYTTLKNPKDLKNIVELIKTVNTGDTLLISGALTHIDNNLKANFKDLIKDGASWNVDLLPTDIRKKNK